MKKQYFVKIKYQLDSFDELYGCYKEFSEGFAVVRSPKGYFYIDECGNRVSNAYYTSAWDFNEGLALIKNARGFSYINHNFETEIELRNFKNIQYIGAGNFHNGRSIIVKKENNNLYFTVINRKGEEILNDKYSYLKFSDGLYLAQNKDGLFGYLDDNFNIVIPFMFDEALCFVNGVAEVTKGKRTYFINKQGKKTNKKDVSVKDDSQIEMTSKWRLASINSRIYNQQEGFVDENFEHLKITEMSLIKPGEYIPKNAENIQIISYVCIFSLDDEDIIIEKENLEEFKKEVDRIQSIINNIEYSQFGDIEEIVLDSHKSF